MTMNDPYDVAARLCDDQGMVSNEPIIGDGPTLDTGYLDRLNRLRNETLKRHGNKPETLTEPFSCTGSAHLAGMHIRCTSPAHNRSVTKLKVWDLPGNYDFEALAENFKKIDAHDMGKTYHDHQREQRRLKRCEELLRDMVSHEDQPCRFDHHGYCQEHGWFGEPGECGIREARELLGLNRCSECGRLPKDPPNDPATCPICDGWEPGDE